MRTRIQNVAAKLFMLFAALLPGFNALAQDQPGYPSSNGSATADYLSADTPGWYSNPIVWVVTSIILVVILAAAARSRMRRRAGNS